MRTVKETSGGPVADDVPTLRRVRSALSETRLRIPVLWLRHRGFRPEDVFLASYPRSGSTWLRFMVYEALTGLPSDFMSVNSSFRPVGEHFHAPGLLPGGGRLIGTHETYRPTYHRAIYLVRDVRDVALSQYLREKQKGVGSSDFDEYLLGLMTGHKRHGSWGDHVLSWLNSGLSSRDLLVLTYENLRRDPVGEFGRVMCFLAAGRDDETLRKVIENNTVERMRAKEDHLKVASVTKVPRHPVSGSHENGRFIRKGKIGGWHDEFTEQQRRTVEMYAGEALLRLGYSLNDKDVARA